jgi:hypothetical protein
MTAVAGQPSRLRNRALALGVVGLVLLILACVLPPFAQPQDYHDFADKRAWWFVPHGGDVMSNLMFLVAGIIGLLAMRTAAARAMGVAGKHAYALMFFGLVLTAFGSGYYHWAPSDERLVWDRLPMTVVFMPLLAATLAERLHGRSDLLLVLLTVLGIGSVVYWQYSGNLLPYLIAQGGAILLIVLALGLLPTPWTRRGMLVPAFACYAVAFACEKLDAQIFHATGGLVSGHTIKHIAAALTFFFIARMLRMQTLKTDTT